VNLSTSEQHLIDFATGRFGEHVTRFLLAGLGEEVRGQRWDFTITYSDDVGKALKRRVRVIAHGLVGAPALLPRRRDPLVLLALLRLVTKGDQVSSYELSYDQKDVLELLGWGDTQGARDEIDGAVRRYMLLTLEWKKNRAELSRENLSHYLACEKIISGSERFNQEGEGRRMVRVLNRVVFDSNFTERLLRQSLFGINWEDVQLITYAAKR
jgi:hypothetical protein